jgi:hypothetical protein
VVGGKRNLDPQKLGGTLAEEQKAGTQGSRIRYAWNSRGASIPVWNPGLIGGENGLISTSASRLRRRFSQFLCYLELNPALSHHLSNYFFARGLEIRAIFIGKLTQHHVAPRSMELRELLWLLAPRVCPMSTTFCPLRAPFLD